MQDLYITGAGRGSGKSIVVLAMMEYLSGETGKIGFFRSVTHSDEKHDPLIELIRHRYSIDTAFDSLYGCKNEVARELINSDNYDELLKRILEKFRRLKTIYDRVLCVGTDYSYANSALEFDFNADVANNLGCLVLPVVRGFARDNSEIVDALTGFQIALQERQCEIFASVVNGVEPTQIDHLKNRIALNKGISGPIYYLPEEPLLTKPTVCDIARSPDVKIILGGHNDLNRRIKSYVVAAMHIPDFLDHLQEDCLVVTPGDRADIILTCFMAYASSSYPHISGLLLTGELLPVAQVEKLLAGFGPPPFAILSSSEDTFTTAMAVNQVKSVLSADNEIKIALAIGLVESHIPLPEMVKTLSSKRSTRVTQLMFEYELIQRAKKELQHIVLPEGCEERILRAAELLALRGVVKITLLGKETDIRQKMQFLGLTLQGVNFIDPMTSDLREKFANTYHTLRQHKGISLDMAYDAMTDVSYFGTMMVYHGYADGMVSGSIHTTQHTIRPAFEIVKTATDISIVSSVFFMCMQNRVLVYGDCAINPNPNAQQLADIAICSANTANMFGVEPRVAMLSYSTGSSGKGAAVEKVLEATIIAKKLRPDLIIEGPIQYDAAIDVNVAKSKSPESKLAGTATVFIFPDLNTGNNTYKAVQRTAGVVAIGPVLQGLNKPINDLSRGCSVADIVNTVAITAIQAQQLIHNE